MNSGKPPGVETCRKIPVLSVSPAESDHETLERLLSPQQWTVYRAETVVSAMSVLRQLRIPIVICEEDLAPHSWTDLFSQLAAFEHPPCLIVTSRVADDYLWAEALNLGAYDVLEQPLDAVEVSRSLGFAWLHWRDHHEAATILPPAARGAAA